MRPSLMYVPPLVWPCVGLALGMVPAWALRHWESLPLVALLACAVLTAAAFFLRPVKVLWVVASFFALSTAVASWRLPAPLPSVAETTGWQGKVADVLPRANGSSEVEVHLQRLYVHSWQAAAGSLRLYGVPPGEAPPPGSHVVGTARISPPPDTPLPFRPTLEATALRRGQVGTAFFDQPLVITKPPSALKSTLNTWKARLRENLQSAWPDPYAQAIAQSLVLGEKSTLPDQLRHGLASSGVLHVLTVSGMHLGLLVLLVALLLGLADTGVVPLWKGLVLLGAIWLYALMVGSGAATVRSAVLFSLLVVGRMVNRPQGGLHGWWVALFVLLAANPWQLLQPGFQFSFLAVLGILVGVPMLRRLWRPASRVADFFWTLAAASLSAQVALLPSLLYFTDHFPLLFLPANLLVVPLMPVAFTLSWVVALFGELPVVGGVVEVLFTWLALAIRWLSRWGELGDWPLFVTPLQSLGVAGLVGTVWLLAQRRPRAIYLAAASALVLLVGQVRLHRWHSTERLAVRAGRPVEVLYQHRGLAWLAGREEPSFAMGGVARPTGQVRPLPSRGAKAAQLYALPGGQWVLRGEKLDSAWAPEVWLHPKMATQAGTVISFIKSDNQWQRTSP